MGAGWGREREVGGEEGEGEKRWGKRRVEEMKR
jgi:hypothetical protein